MTQQSIVRPRSPESGLHAWLALKTRLLFSETRVRCSSDVVFALSVSAIWLALYNVRFWESTAAAMWHPTLGTAAFFASLAILLLGAQALLLLLMPTRWLMRVMASAMFIVAASSAYFISAYGALMNKDMMRNVLETDPAEVTGLVNLDFLAHLLLLGVLPAVLIWRVELPQTKWSQQMWQRLKFVVCAAVVSAVAVFAASAHYAVFLREHKPLRYEITPAAATSSAIGLIASSSHNSNEPLLNAGGPIERSGPVQKKPLVIFLVVGETARAADFQLAGYGRDTNAELKLATGLTFFSHATSCGTATAYSVPCMFSHFGRERFSIDEAKRYTNLLDAFAQAGFDIEWRDNNAGCKGVCTRVKQISYADRSDAALCPHGYCFDEIMLTDLAARLNNIDRDTLIVFHQIGSHGPAYSERYPPAFERFKPACHTNELNKCSPQEIVNAYDNSIAYTDHVLARQIGMLKAAGDHVDSLLIYLSDHGESLGEQGVYLHGLPYSFAPRQQKEIPFLIWTSQGFAERTQLDSSCLSARALQPASHDNLYHTMLGAGDMRNAVYRPELDLISRCRARGKSGETE
jgi:lipid A ethanolaminephosphotransferase